MATTLQHLETILKILSPNIAPIILAIAALYACKHFDFIYKSAKTIKKNNLEENNSIEIRAKYKE